MKDNSEVKSSLKRFWMLLHQHRNEVNSVYIYAFFSALISFTVPVGIQAIVNLIQGAQISTSWVLIVVLVSLGIVFSGFLLIMQQIVLENIQQKIFVNSAFDFAYRIPRFKAEAVDRTFIPELVNRFFDTIVVQKGVSKIILDYSMAIIQVALGLILLMFYHPFFISFGIILILIVFFIFKYTFHIGLRTSISESKYKYKLVHWLEDLGRSMKTFKLAGITDLPLSKTDIITTEWIKYRKSHFRILLIQYISMVGFKALIAAGLLVIGGILVINQQMNIGQFVAAEIIILMILSAIEKLITGFETFFDVLTSIEKLGEVMDIPEESNGAILLDGDAKGLRVQINNLSFAFTGNTEKALNEIDLLVQPGEKIGITGYNGSGKSTLLKVLAGLYHEFSGTLSYNDIPVRNMDVNALRGIIGDNLIDNTLFEGTIYENITMGKEGVNVQEVIQICEVIDLLPYIQTFPQGLETVLLSEGKTLSNSLKLKIILARCIAEKPKLILLEDNFNQLESELREKLIRYFFDKNKSWTVIMATSNTDYLCLADRIIILDKGVKTEEGTLNELINKASVKKLFYKSDEDNE